MKEESICTEEIQRKVKKKTKEKQNLRRKIFQSGN